MAGSSGRQNTHRFREVVFTFQRLHRSRKFVRLFNSMAFYKRLAKSLQRQLETTTTKNKLKNLRKQYKYPRASPECFSEVTQFSKCPCPPRWLLILIISWVTNYSLILGGNSGLIYNFTCEITKMPWQRSDYVSVPRWRLAGGKVLESCEWRFLGIKRHLRKTYINTRKGTSRRILLGFFFPKFWKFWT